MFRSARHTIIILSVIAMGLALTALTHAAGKVNMNPKTSMLPTSYTIAGPGIARPAAGSQLNVYISDTLRNLTATLHCTKGFGTVILKSENVPVASISSNNNFFTRASDSQRIDSIAIKCEEASDGRCQCLWRVDQPPND